jgi:hypothetical protein
MSEPDPPIEVQEKELLDAGWEKMGFGVWRSPEGGTFLGPHQAWMVMKGLV